MKVVLTRPQIDDMSAPLSPTARPILMSAPMVRALLAGTKSQTRRALKYQPIDIIPMPKAPDREWVILEQREPEPKGKLIRCRFGVPGDLLWVRESWQHAPQKYCSCPQPSEASPCDDWSEGTGCQSNRGEVIYAADGVTAPRWRPSIHMPRRVSRLTLTITSVRVERLQDISEADAKAEGIERCEGEDGWKLYGPLGRAIKCLDARSSYRSLWEEINGKGSWAANPWVWVIAFRPELRNVDEVPRAAA
ncbi:MAG TPA: hypothetical protein VFB54_12040 [Burkholderiales bacterium]|nr:hypothetical protein [Burkholderiales bacterium]